MNPGRLPPGLAVLLILLSVPLPLLPGQSLRRVADINTLPAAGALSSFPEARLPFPDPWWNWKRFARLGSRIFFSALGRSPGTGALTGGELFSAARKPGSVRLEADILPGKEGSYPGVILVHRGRLYFPAILDSRTNHQEIFEYDPSRTPSLKKLTNLARWFPLSGKVYGLLGLGSSVFFCVDIGTQHRLCRKDLSTGVLTVLAPLFFPWRNAVVLGNKVLFSAVYGSSGACAWVTDGTFPGTRRLRSFPNGGFEFPVRVGSLVYFAAKDSSGWGIWKTDGTAGGTKRVTLFPPGSGNTVPPYWLAPLALGKKILFAGPVNRGYGFRPCALDVSSPTPKIVFLTGKPPRKGTGFCNPAVLGGAVYFAGYHDGDAAHPEGWYLWRTQGTPGTTRILTAAGFQASGTPGASWSQPTLVHTSSSGDFLLFVGLSPSGITALWRTDGTARGTRQAAVVGTGRPGSIDFLTAFPGGAFFQGFDPRTGYELWWTDGTPGGTGLHTDILSWRGPPRPNQGSWPAGFSELLGVAYFRADDGFYGRELWRTDGTALGTWLVKDIFPGAGSSTPFSLFPHRAAGLLFFLAASPEGLGLWRTDGTAAGTRRVLCRIGGTKDFSSKVPLGKRLLFDNTDPATGKEVWITDGEKASLLKDCAPGGGAKPNSGGFRDPVRIGDRVFFLVQGSRGFQLWETDGTSAGTRAVPLPVKGVSSPIRCGRGIFFGGFDPSLGAEPWFFDPEKKRAILLKDILPGKAGSAPSFPFSLGSRVFFFALNGLLPSGYRLWVTDGTPGGTRRVSPQDFSWVHRLPGREHQDRDPWGLAFGDGGRAFFFGKTAKDGYEPWVTDGTAAGTFQLATTYPGRDNGDLCLARRVGMRKICFGLRQSFWKGVRISSQLWVTDGTRRGTFPVTGLLAPGFVRSWDPSSRGVGVCRGQVFFCGLQLEARSKGYELFAWFPGATVMPLGAGARPDPRFFGSDPVLGGRLTFRFQGGAGKTAGLVILADPTGKPLLSGGSGFYFDPFRIYRIYPVLLSGGSGAVSFAVPNSIGLLGAALAGQGFLYPSTAAFPIGLDPCRGLFLSFGR